MVANSRETFAVGYINPLAVPLNILNKLYFMLGQSPYQYSPPLHKFVCRFQPKCIKACVSQSNNVPNMKSEHSNYYFCLAVCTVWLLQSQDTYFKTTYSMETFRLPLVPLNDLTSGGHSPPFRFRSRRHRGTILLPTSWRIAPFHWGALPRCQPWGKAVHFRNCTLVASILKWQSSFGTWRYWACYGSRS